MATHGRHSPPVAGFLVGMGVYSVNNNNKQVVLTVGARVSWVAHAAEDGFG